MDNIKSAIKTPEEILKDLENVSPLALPAYLQECEYFDRSDAFEELEKAIEQFEGKGGVANSLLDTTLKAVINSVTLVLLRKFNEPLYKKVIKTKSTDFTTYAKKAFTFSLDDYDEETRALYTTPSALQQDALRRGMVRHPGEADKNGNYDPLFDADKYRREKDFEVKTKSGKKRSREFVEKCSEDGKTVRGAGGQVLSIDKKNGDPTTVAQGDHVVPLKKIHEDRGKFVERYLDSDTLQNIVNDDANFQIISKSINCAKGGGMTNIQYIEQCEKIETASELYKKMETASGAEKKALQKEISELGLSPVKRKAARNMANKDKLTEKEKKDLEKYELTEEQKKELRENQKKAEAKIRDELLKGGAKTVLLEQVGKLIETLIGPISFELRDSIKNGITSGFDGCNSFEAFCKRLWRALKYIFKELARILGETMGDLGKMLATFFMNACKMIKDLFGKIFDVLVSGISVLVDSIKILMGQGSAAEKGEAILKLVVGFVTGILGQTVIDNVLNSLGVPAPFSDIFSAIFSAVISTLVMAGFEKLDIFGLKREMLRKRIDEIFDARAEKLSEASRAFDMATLQTLKKNREAMETIRLELEKGMREKDFESLNETLDEAC